MSHHDPNASFPSGVLLAAAALVGVALLATGATSFTGVGRMANHASTPVERTELHFADRDDGAVVVTAAASAEVVAVFEPGTNGFVRSVMRGMGRERKLRGLDREPPYQLTRWADGRLSLEDPSTGRSVELDAFGPDNALAFAQLMRQPTHTGVTR